MVVVFVCGGGACMQWWCLYLEVVSGCDIVKAGFPASTY